MNQQPSVGYCPDENSKSKNHFAPTVLQYSAIKVPHTTEYFWQNIKVTATFTIFILLNINNECKFLSTMIHIKFQSAIAQQKKDYTVEHNV